YGIVTDATYWFFVECTVDQSQDSGDRPKFRISKLKDIINYDKDTWRVEAESVLGQIVWLMKKMHSELPGQGYYQNRDMNSATQKAIMQEWEGWMATFRSSNYKILVDLSRVSRNHARAAKKYLLDKALVGRKLDMLVTSRDQLRDNEAEMTSMLQSDCISVSPGVDEHESRGEELDNSQVFRLKRRGSNIHEDELGEETTVRSTPSRSSTWHWE
ncbi:hypothetical protein BGZ47_003900, partial [Haplosporangium gracile]